MTKGKITNFHELVEAVEGLEIDISSIIKIKEGLCLSECSFRIDSFDYKIVSDQEFKTYSLVVNDRGMRLTKDPQKIYNIIKAIKDYKDE